MINVEQTIISQYGTSSTIGQLIRNMNEYIDPTADIDNFYNYVWNVETAQGFGLNILGRIVNIQRVWPLPNPGPYFGFQDGTKDYYPFGDQGTFYDESNNENQQYWLSDDAYRTLILIKALSNISLATSPSINRLLNNIFDGDGRCYINDLGGMGIRYVFEFILSPYQRAIVTRSGIMLRPAGVTATMISTSLPCFGFSEAGTITVAPFGQAPFISGDAIDAVS